MDRDAIEHIIDRGLGDDEPAGDADVHVGGGIHVVIELYVEGGEDGGPD